eukprot:gnl/Chilomastix_cuspidata/4749.p2 GENE.gnl/Chilomastix_cuspidata/4749~~gnl/Chilomastix_cuspidata/4749.p2  ORF type:complete len:370 (+),score=128.74 gnl/Chilomastix_cuspidata/4749:38-1111(+)
MSSFPQAIATVNQRFIADFVKKNCTVSFSAFGLFHVLLILLKTVEGPARRQLAAVLGVDDDALEPRAIARFLKKTAADRALEAAANIFARGAEPRIAYAALMRQTFGAEPEALESAEQVNRWCAAHTRGAIPAMLDTLDADTRAVLASALFFQARWRKPFAAHMTTDRLFHTLGGAALTRPTMRTERPLAYTQTAHSQAAALEYAGSRAVALVLLPRAKGRRALRRSAAELTVELATTAAHMPRRPLRLLLPRFRVDATLSLVRGLQHLGALKVFRSCDATGTLGQDLTVSDIIQRCTIEVSEKGTVAAAATAVIMSNSCTFSEPDVTIMDCNRPFIFSIILPKTGTFLFTTIVGLE